MTKTPTANQTTCCSPYSLLSVELRFSRSSFPPSPPTVTPTRSIRLSPDKAQHPRIIFLHPWNPLASLLVGLPSLLSFVPLSFPSFFPQRPQGSPLGLTMRLWSFFPVHLWEDC